MNLGLKELEQELYNHCKVSGILPTSTKGRRLGYLKLILSLFEESDYYPLSYFSQKVESVAQDINNFLSEYRNNKGRIELTRNGTSAKPYVDLSISLGTITEVNRSYILSKHSKVYRAIEEQIYKEGLGDGLICSRLHVNEPAGQLKLFDTKPNPFRLNLFEQVFFLYHILATDALYFWAIVDIVSQGNLQSERSIRAKFQTQILNELKEQLESKFLSNVEKRNALEIANRIRKWEKPDVYLEHIILPRLNWLLDLDLIDSEQFSKRLIKLTDSGIRLQMALSHFHEEISEKSTVISLILEKSFFQLINYTYNLANSRFSTSKIATLEQCVEDSFKYFRTAAPNSIAASQAIFYSCYSMLLQHKSILEFEEAKDLLVNNQFPAYTLDWYKRENDGSLQRRK